MVSYLLIMFLLTIVIVGVAFNFVSDFVFYVINAINGYQNTPLYGQLDQSSVDTGNFLTIIFNNFLIIGLLVLIYWVWQMSLKPAKPW
jgi:hypothetical protein